MGEHPLAFRAGRDCSSLCHPRPSQDHLQSQLYRHGARRQYVRLKSPLPRNGTLTRVQAWICWSRARPKTPTCHGYPH